MDYQPDFAPFWTSDQPFDDPEELASFIQLPENDGPEFAQVRRVLEIGHLAKRRGFCLPAAAFLDAIHQLLAETHDWLLGLTAEELDDYVWDVMR